MAPDDALARQAGVLLGGSKTSDAVDEIVVATAVALRAILTSDVDDISTLVEAARTDFVVAIGRV